jgi:hypothetical protein
MTKDDITPPAELVRGWLENTKPSDNPNSPLDLATRAAQWGADQELESCRAFLLSCHGEDYGLLADSLRAARRPKQTSLKRVALLQLDTLNADLGLEGRGIDLSQIRRALEQLSDG